ncbi:MAG: hypothetical protein ILA19_03300 [Bacilli bacterium]|nr:hypothetical protein [Bacilli bacterium]
MEKEVKEENKPVKKQEEKKSGASAAAIIILVVIIIGFMVYIAYDKGYIFKSKQTKEKSTPVETNKKENKENKTVEPTSGEAKEIDLDDSRFIGIYKKLQKYTYSMNRENGYKSFSDKDLATIAIKSFKEADFEKTSEKDNGSTYYKFKGDTIIKHLKNYFKSDVTINKEKLNDLFVATNVNFDGSGMQIKSYDKDKDEYKVIFGGIGGTSGPSPKITARKIISATKQEDGSIKVVEKAIYYTSTIFNDDMYFNIYSDPSNNYNIDGKHFKVSNVTNEKIDVNDYSDKASTITHIFKLDKETGDYYFASSVIK